MIGAIATERMADLTQQQEQLKGRGATLLKALVHDLRFRIMIVLTDREASPKELAEELGADLKRVCDHMAILERDGFIELVDTDTRNGGTIHVFRAKVRPFISSPDAAGLSVQQREETGVPTVQAMIVDMVRATEAGTLDSRPNRVLVRMPLILDDDGFREADESAIRHMEELHEIQARSLARRAKTGDPGTNAATATAIYALP